MLNDREKFFGNAKFLTLDPEKYPEFAVLPATYFVPFERKFVAAQFRKQVGFSDSGRAVIRVFADTKFRLTVNGQVLGVGPVAAGGDYDNRLAMPKQYFNTYEIVLDGGIDILCEVQTPGLVQTDYSCEKGGFILCAKVALCGRELEIVTDESWEMRVDTQFDTAFQADFTRELPDWQPAVTVPEAEVVWQLADPRIPALCESLICPSKVTEGEGKTRFEFDRIYSAYVKLSLINKGDAARKIEISASEYGGKANEFLTIPVGKTLYRGFRMWSIGEVTVWHGADVEVTAQLVFVRYPVDYEKAGSFVCSDEGLNLIYELGKSTLEICRQSLHLDSPLHQETLGCTGDYAIENLMTSVTFGDMRLTRLDLVRTSDYLKLTGGYMFHTSYSLIFVTMLRDYYLFTADIETVRELLPTVELLFFRFSGYIDDDVIENPPNYMFVDWGELDGFNLHHPPKALGQTVLNGFYRMALLAASELYSAVGDDSGSDELKALADRHKEACNRRFYDEQRGMYFDGTPAPESEYEAGKWLPVNARRRYYTRQANALAVLCGFTDDASLMARVADSILEGGGGFENLEVQPYFMHYVLEGIRKVGLFGKYGLKLINLWDRQVMASPKGMKEGWGSFIGDNSHAWGATPTYQLPMAITGLKILKPGFGEYRLSPELYGLKWAKVRIPLPDSMISLELGDSGNQIM